MNKSDRTIKFPAFLRNDKVTVNANNKSNDGSGTKKLSTTKVSKTSSINQVPVLNILNKSTSIAHPKVFNRLQFSNKIEVILVPDIKDYKTSGLHDRLWYTTADIESFRKAVLPIVSRAASPTSNAFSNFKNHDQHSNIAASSSDYGQYVEFN